MPTKHISRTITIVNSGGSPFPINVDVLQWNIIQLFSLPVECGNSSRDRKLTQKPTTIICVKALFKKDIFCTDNSLAFAPACHISHTGNLVSGGFVIRGESEPASQEDSPDGKFHESDLGADIIFGMYLFIFPLQSTSRKPLKNATTATCKIFNHHQSIRPR